MSEPARTPRTPRYQVHVPGTCTWYLGGATALLVAVLFAGCAIGKDYRRPDVQVPDSTRGQLTPVESASLADLSWWEIFADARLQALLEEALVANHDLRAATARVEQARQLVGIARSEMLPL